MKDLFSILACPTCKTHVEKREDYLLCASCGIKFPIVKGVPVILPDGTVPAWTHQKDLTVRTGYDPWIPRLIIQSLLDNQIVLDVGAGNMSLDDPCVIRMDITLTPYVDVVADLHALPFLPDSIDCILSLAVMEHLKNPFQAADSMYDTLKDGGIMYHECNFVWPYHGFPHHYFNASLQGLESVFERFRALRKGVAPYQMPSFALGSVIDTFLNLAKIGDHPHGRHLAGLLRQVKQHNLQSYDIYFTEETAPILAAGVYFCGVKQKFPDSSIIPEIIQNVRDAHDTVRERFPDILNLACTDNILLWAQQDGRHQFPEIDGYMNALTRFNKRGVGAEFDRSYIRNSPCSEPLFGAIGFDPAEPLEVKQERAVAKDFSLWQKMLYVLETKGFTGFLHRIISYIKRRM